MNKTAKGWTKLTKRLDKTAKGLDSSRHEEITRPHTVTPLVKRVVELKK
jgi:hypothetical protein